MRKGEGKDWQGSLGQTRNAGQRSVCSIVRALGSRGSQRCGAAGTSAGFHSQPGEPKKSVSNRNRGQGCGRD